MKVPFVDLKKGTQRIRKPYLKAIGKFLDGGNFILTKEIADFERAFASMTGAKHCVGVSSGSDALYVALTALGVGPGDEVITQGTAYNASVTAILRAGATPRFVDIDPDTLGMDASKLDRVLTGRTKAILPVHLYGQMNDMAAITEFARANKLFVVEDCAQSHLASFQGRPAGTWGDIGCFSFYPAKNLGAFGDAGAVITNDAGLAEKMRALRNLGQVAKNDHVYLGFNHRLDTMQAIALKLKLKYLKSDTKKRQQAAYFYDMLLKKYNLPFKPVARMEKDAHVYHLYVVQSLKMNRDLARAELKKQGVETLIHYPLAVYHQPFYRGPIDACPTTDTVLNRIFSLPMYPDITKAQQTYVVECLRKLI